MTVTIKPTKIALSALKNSRTMRVSVTIAFHPRSGSPATLSETVYRSALAEELQGQGYEIVAGPAAMGATSRSRASPRVRARR